MTLEVNSMNPHDDDEHTGSAKRATANGIAPLDGSGLLLLADIPTTLTGKEIQTSKLLEMNEQSFVNLLNNSDFESWSAGTTVPPDGWVTTGTAPTIAKETVITKTGSTSVLLTANTTNSALKQVISNPIQYRGRVVTAGMWIKSSNAGAKIFLVDSSGYYHNEHSGSGNWEFITQTITVDAATIILEVHFTPDHALGSNAAYFDGVILVEGSICPAFNLKPLSANDLNIHMQTPQTLTGAGAINITTDITHIITNGVNALTLIDGTNGQEKFIIMKTDVNDGTLTPDNLGNGTTITFNDVGDSAHLLFTNGKWYFMGGTATLT